MSFIGSEKRGYTYAPGWFLANNEDCTRQTRQMDSAAAYVADGEGGGSYVPMGTVYPANDGTAEGIVYEDVDVSSGDMPGSVVLSGVIYKSRLPVALNSAAETALAGKGFVFIEEDAVVRPY